MIEIWKSVAPIAVIPDESRTRDRGWGSFGRPGRFNNFNPRGRDRESYRNNYQGYQPRQVSNPGFSSIQTDELKVEYRAIADTYSRLRLPGDMRYNGSRVEVKQSCKDATYALTTSARYLETCLKIASYMQRVFMQDPEDFDCSQYVDKLLTYLMAHMRYLQEYFYALVV